MKHPFCRWCAPLALALSLGGWIGGSLFTDRHPAELRVVSVSAASPGDTAEITYNGSEKKFCDGVVHRWLIDKDDGYHDLTDTNVFRPDPGETPVTFYHDFDVPKKMPLGPRRLSFRSGAGVQLLAVALLPDPGSLLRTRSPLNKNRAERGGHARREWPVERT